MLASKSVRFDLELQKGKRRTLQKKEKKTKKEIKKIKNINLRTHHNSHCFILVFQICSLILVVVQTLHQRKTYNSSSASMGQFIFNKIDCQLIYINFNIKYFVKIKYTEDGMVYLSKCSQSWLLMFKNSVLYSFEEIRNIPMEI